MRRPRVPADGGVGPAAVRRTRQFPEVQRDGGFVLAVGIEGGQLVGLTFRLGGERRGSWVVERNLECLFIDSDSLKLP